MDDEMYTLDEIRPTWFRRLVMMIISPFMLVLMTSAWLFFIFIMAMVMIAHPTKIRKTWNDFNIAINGWFLYNIYYWHVDIWNGVTIRDAPNG